MKKQANKKKYILKNRKRFISFIACLALLIVFAAATVTANGYKEPGYRTVMISGGDTLWDIALRHKTQNEDIRKFIYKIKKLNNMQSSSIYEGDLLKIPF